MARVFFAGLVLSVAVFVVFGSPYPQEETATTGSSNNNNNNNNNNQIQNPFNCTQIQEQCMSNNNNIQNGANQGQGQFQNQTNQGGVTAPPQLSPDQIQNNNVTNICSPDAVQWCNLNQWQQNPITILNPNQVNQTQFNPNQFNQTQFNPNQIQPNNTLFNPNQISTFAPIQIPSGRK